MSQDSTNNPTPRPKTTHLEGRKFGRWTVIASASRRNYWKCVCDCGTEKEIQASGLVYGGNQSCGCLKLERLRKHGHTAYRKPPSGEYRSYSSMRARCYNKNSDVYIYYGGRGIKICDRWLESFANFLEDMGERPSLKHSLERKDNDGDYSPENCYWATKSQQNRNKRNNHYVDYQGRRLTIAECCEIANLPWHIICQRLNRGWDIEKAVMTPVRPYMT